MRFSALQRAEPWVVVMAAMAVLAGCASGPSTAPGRDGPGANPPPDLARVPDAEPQVQTIRSGGPNKPYDVAGRSYVPITRDAPFTERGLASWYGKAFHGRRTASGEVYNMYAMTAAHPTLPIPSYARVRNPANGREIVVRINDRGPFHAGRVLDLSYTAALKLDLLRGVGPVELQRITFDDIRTGAWRRDAPTLLAAAAPVPLPVATPSSTPSPTPAAAPLAAPAAPAEPVAPPPLPTPEPEVALAPTPVVATVSVAEPVADAPSARAYTAPARGFWVQLGAFRQRDGAESFQQRVATELDWLSPLLAVFNDAALFRLQAGPYPSRNDARLAAERIRDGLRLVPVIVERR
ncbi:MAG: septal ring lytic transglycosylase RlpA family protein [Burkholderiales bacterium]